MKLRKRLRILALLAGASVGMAQPAHAQQAGAAASGTPAQSVASWDAMIEGVRNLPAEMLARLPPERRNDPQVQQEVAHLALEALASASIDALGSDGDHPQFLPQIGAVLNVGQPNADTNYRVARITPGGVYRISGERGSLRLANISEAPASPGEVGFVAGAQALRPVHNLNALHADAHGRFDVILSPERPANYRGDWWRLQPTTTKLLMRLVSSNWGHERDPTISIERIDAPVQRPRPSAEALAQQLRQLPNAANFIGLLFVDHVEQLRRAGLINSVKVMNPPGALAGQFYYEGAYDLADDQALIVEARAPAHCEYRSLILTDELYQTTDWYNNFSSLNDSQADLDHDRVLRIVISAHDPGVPNWLDTAGHARGALQGRWTNCDSQPIPSARVVPLSEVRAAFPAGTPVVTPQQREQMIRERRAALQQRPLW